MFAGDYSPNKAKHKLEMGVSSCSLFGGGRGDTEFIISSA